MKALAISIILNNLRNDETFLNLPADLQENFIQVVSNLPGDILELFPELFSFQLFCKVQTRFTLACLALGFVPIPDDQINLMNEKLIESIPSGVQEIDTSTFPGLKANSLIELDKEEITFDEKDLAEIEGLMGPIEQAMLEVFGENKEVPVEITQRMSEKVKQLYDQKKLTVEDVWMMQPSLFVVPNL